MKKPQLVYTTYIRTTPKHVWDAITKPEFTRKYWGDMTNVSDWKKGSKWEHQNPDKEVWITGKVVEAAAPKRLVLTWAAPERPKDISRVIFELEPVKDMVKLVVIHDRLQPGSKMLKGVSNGWPLVLSSLKSYLETGKPLDARCGD